MATIKKRHRRKPGQFLRIGLGGGYFSYAQELADGSIAVYDARTKKELDLEEVARRKILFIVPVMNDIITKGRWPVVGELSLEKKLSEPREYFIQDEFDPEDIQIYGKNDEIRPATYAEAKKLERMAVWEANHVEDRIRDHYAGRKCQWCDPIIKPPKKR